MPHSASAAGRSAPSPRPARGRREPKRAHPDHEVARGLKGVIATETRLSHVDGERGVLVIGGFPVETLAPHAAFEDVLFLLWHDRVPTADESTHLRRDLAASRAMPDAALPLLRAAAARSLPAMDALRMSAATLSLSDPAPDDPSRSANLARAVRAVATFPTLAAAYARLCEGRAPLTPRGDLGHVANYLYMLSGDTPSPNSTRALETYFNTVVDHGMNASTFTARVIASTRSDLISALVGAVGALKGPLHGGAPGPALDMVFEIRRRAAASGRSLAEEAGAWVRETLTHGDRVMGFGHRVYKVRDPRADVLGEAARDLFVDHRDRALYDDVRAIEGVVVHTLGKLKPGRRLETNVEFYTAMLLHGVGLPTELFTPTFALARAGGWTAHVIEQLDQDQLIRPESRYVGGWDRTWA